MIMMARHENALSILNNVSLTSFNQRKTYRKNYSHSFERYSTYLSRKTRFLEKNWNPI